MIHSYEDCDRCGERYSGGDIKVYLVEVEEAEGTGSDPSTVTGIYCRTCLPGHRSEFSKPCDRCDVDVPESDAHGEEKDWLCPDCYPRKGGE